ncbi:hypothetical protein [Acetobacterium tundrae]|uniref:Phage protein n=1 Tax=Acetobacterium tundrae TaxID=132932 RepID=A0ABR6WIX1_9FIRM|nr:hypothetical protein [Acetobacterium tundrae]MBC3796434.1 hypothetical protein [Acetobacterium tundrae]
MVSKTVLLIEEVKKILQNVYLDVFYIGTTKTTPYPYITFQISDIGVSKKLELDYWTDQPDSIELETLADNVGDYLNKYTLTNENHSITIYKNNDRQRLDETIIKRINESYMVRYFGKEE